ncbi:hypothetical protein [Pseudothermotoga sp.]|uniref:hypothetical protein n=1 Tax=Pseudothermotoga sp. TaxID=2033661 RepID=UPI0031F70329
MSSRQANLFVAYFVIFSLIFTLNVAFHGKPAKILFYLVRPIVYPADVTRHFLHNLSQAISTIYHGDKPVDTVRINDIIFEQSQVVLGYRQYYLVATGQAKVGDIAIDPENKRFVGVVRQVNAHLCWIERWDSPTFSMPVKVEANQISLEGELLGGTRLRIYEEIDVTGFVVKISEHFTNGTLLRKMECDLLGTVVGRHGEFFLVKIDPVRPSHLVYLSGY